MKHRESGLRALITAVLCAALASAGVSSFAAAPPEDAIILKATTFTPPSEEPDIPEDLKYTEHRGYYLIQLTEHITTGVRDELVAAGVDFVGYIPNRAYLVKMTEETKD